MVSRETYWAGLEKFVNSGNGAPEFLVFARTAAFCYLETLNALAATRILVLYSGARIVSVMYH